MYSFPIGGAVCVGSFCHMTGFYDQFVAVGKFKMIAIRVLV